MNDVNVGFQTTSFIYNSPTKSTDYQVKITDDEICFPNKIALKMIISILKIARLL